MIAVGAQCEKPHRIMKEEMIFDMKSSTVKSLASKTDSSRKADWRETLKIDKWFPWTLAILNTFILICVFLMPELSPQAVLNNFLLALSMTAILCLLPIGWYAVYIINFIILSGIFYMNDFLLNVRSRPLHFIDLFCIKDGLNLADHYAPVFQCEMIIKIICGASIVFFSCFAVHKLCNKEHFRRWKVLCGTVLCVTTFTLVAAFHFGEVWKVEAMESSEAEYYERNGLLFALYSEYINSEIAVPENYSDEKVAQILDSYSTDDAPASAATEPVNIIVIMNEALADYSLIGTPDFKEDPLPQLHAMDQNCFKGRCAVNIFGGRTCNTEFEFLTGCSLAFFPDDSIPYLQNSMNGVPSLASEMEQLSWKSTAIHPYFGQEWKRTQVYPGLGFSDFIAGDQFSEQYTQLTEPSLFRSISEVQSSNFGSDLEYVRGFISDAECYRKILKTADTANTAGSNSFLFAVTIQNHGGYQKELFEEFESQGMTEYLDASYHEASEDADAIEQYLNLTRISDEAFAELVEKLENSSTPTVVVMFGDHQPGIDFNCYKDRLSDGQGELADEYIVPFVLWANYDITWDAPEFVSINYLSCILKRNCGIPLTSFDCLRERAMEHYPVLTTNFAVDNNGNYVTPAIALKDPVVHEYQTVQYSRLFGK